MDNLLDFILFMFTDPFMLVFYLILLLVIIIYVYFGVYKKISIEGRNGYKNLLSYVEELEKAPSSPVTNQKILDIINKNPWIQSKDIFSDDGVLEKTIKCLNNKKNYSNILLRNTFLCLLTKYGKFIVFENKKDAISKSIFLVIENYLNFAPLDREVHDFAIETLKQLSLSNIQCKNIYNWSLINLESNPDNLHCKQFVLSAGRLYYASIHPNRQITVKDEQAIQNDILIRIN